MSLRNKLKNNIFFHTIGKFILDSYCFYVFPIFESISRFFTNIFGKYNYLKKFKDIHKGERCFIVCTGPSLNFNDLSLIKNEICFSMNSIIKILDKTEWYPKYYGVQDDDVFAKMRDIYSTFSHENFFVANNTFNKNKDVLQNKNVNVFRLYYGNIKRNLKKPRIKFSKDITHGVDCGYTITYSLMQIAIYMGFKEIYLIGCDSNYDPDPNKRYFVSHGHIDPNAPVSVQFQMQAYSKAKEYADKHNIKIFNATRGGKLEVFPRISLEEVISNG